MKRFSTLAPAALGALLLISSFGVARPATSDKAYTVRVTAKTSPGHDRSQPYTFTTRGKISPPTKWCRRGVKPTKRRNCIAVACAPGVRDSRYCVRPSRRRICSGVVNVRLHARTRTLSSHDVRVGSKCTFRSEVSLSPRSSFRGVLKVKVSFRGNRFLRSKAAPGHTVRAG